MILFVQQNLVSVIKKDKKEMTF